MRVAERPDLLSVVVLGVGATLAGYVLAFAASALFATWVYADLGRSLDPNSPLVAVGIAFATLPAWVGLAIGGRIYEGPGAVVGATAFALLVAVLDAGATLILPDGLIFTVPVSGLLLGLLGVSSIAGELRRGLGGMAGGVIVGLVVGLLDPALAWLLETATVRFALLTETTATVQLAVTLIEAVFTGGLFWLFVGLGERLADR
jgi:hypothetical protein